MKVGIDTTPLTNQSAFRGVGYYTKNLIESLQKTGQVEVYPDHWQKIYDKVDILHFPFFDFYFLTLPFLKRKKTIVTVHDCIPLIFPEKYPAGVRGKLKFFLQKINLKKTEHVLTDSESSKKDIKKYLNFPEEKITVVYLAASHDFKRVPVSQAKKTEEKYCLPKRFVLYVGDINWNKNLPSLIKAFSKAKLALKNTVYKDIKLIFVGKAFENKDLKEIKEIKDLVNSERLAKEVIFLGFIPTPDLVNLYNLALVYCQPSFYEGFGLQVLEAMACGCPVITSNVSSLPEIGGDASVYADPYQIQEISDSLVKVITDEKYREKMIKKGLEQSAKFSWEKTAQQTIQVYEKVFQK